MTLITALEESRLTGVWIKRTGDLLWRTDPLQTRYSVEEIYAADWEVKCPCAK